MAQIRAPKESEPAFAYSFHADTGRRVKGWLTFALDGRTVDLEDDERRTLLLTDDCTLVPVDLRQSFEDFRRLLPNGDKNRVNDVKGLVNMIHRGGMSLQNVALAVHKFGPVPVFVLPQSHRVPGAEYDVQVAIYPSRQKSCVRARHPFMPTTAGSISDYRNSIKIQPGRVFRRYLEDAGAALKDIRRLLGVADGLRRAKQIETTLGESVQSKLDLLVPKTPLPQTILKSIERYEHVDAVRAWRTFEETAYLLLSVTHAKNFILFLVNEYYSHLGLVSRSEEYRKRLATIGEQFGMLLGQDFVREWRETSESFTFLSECLGIYEFGNSTPDEPHKHAEKLLLHAKASRCTWHSEIAKFASFLVSVQIHKAPRHRARIFFSYPFEARGAELVREKIVKFLESEYSGEISGVQVRTITGGITFRRAIRSAIWASDATLAIIPAHLHADTTGVEKSLDWLAVEAEHSLLLKKHLLFAIEAGLDAASAGGMLEKSMEALLCDDIRLRNAGDRRREVAGRFVGMTRAVFRNVGSGGNGDDLDPGFRLAFQSFVREAVDNRALGVLGGLLRQFDQVHRATLLEVISILFVHQALGKKRIAEELCRRYPERYFKVDQAVKFFEAMWAKVKERGVAFGAKEVKLLKCHRSKHKYVCRIMLLAAAQYPKTSRDKLRANVINFLRLEFYKVTEGSRVLRFE